MSEEFYRTTPLLSAATPLSVIESGLREIAAEQVPPSLLAADENAGSLDATVGMTSPKLIAPLPTRRLNAHTRSPFFNRTLVLPGAALSHYSAALGCYVPLSGMVSDE